ncbi:MAG: septum formation initiator family protein [bacterium]|nr:septum formation initiator family protein [bacterium]
MKNKWQWIVIVAGILIAARQGVALWKLWKTGEQVSLATSQLQQEQLKNQQLKQRLAEISSPEFIEREARDKLGYGREGETTLILPDPSTNQSTLGESDIRPNWRKWWDLYIRI